MLSTSIRQLYDPHFELDLDLDFVHDGVNSGALFQGGACYVDNSVLGFRLDPNPKMPEWMARVRNMLVTSSLIPHPIEMYTKSYEVTSPTICRQGKVFIAQILISSHIPYLLFPPSNLIVTLINYSAHIQDALPRDLRGLHDKRPEQME